MKARANDTEMELVNAGLHKARCIRVIDRGTHKSEKWGNYNHQLMIMFELPETQMSEGELKGQPFSVCIFPNLTIGEKSNLRKHVVGWLGRSITPEEEENGFDVMQLLDKPAYLNIVHNEGYANVASISPLSEEECPPRINDLVKFDLDNFDDEVFKGLSEKMQNHIKESREWPHRFEAKKPGEIGQAVYQAEKESMKAEAEKVFGNQDLNKPDDVPEQKQFKVEDFFEFMLSAKEILKRATGSHSFYNSELRNKFDIQFLSQVKGDDVKQKEIREDFEGLIQEAIQSEL
jgi:hypothetical protein